MESKTKRLNIGCGNVPVSGYTNVDKYYYPGSSVYLTYRPLADVWNQTHPESPWLYGDAVHLEFPDESFDEVIMVHVLEHLSMEDGNLAIKEAYRVLKSGGKIEIEVPDLTRACENFLRVHITSDGDNQPWHRIMGCIYGTTGMDGEGQFHLCGYSKEYLIFKLNERGLKGITEIPVGFAHGNDTEVGHPEPEFDFRLRAYK